MRPRLHTGARAGALALALCASLWPAPGAWAADAAPALRVVASGAGLVRQLDRPAPAWAPAATPALRVVATPAGQMRVLVGTAGTVPAPAAAATTAVQTLPGGALQRVLLPGP